MAEGSIRLCVAQPDSVKTVSSGLKQSCGVVKLACRCLPHFLLTMMSTKHLVFCPCRHLGSGSNNNAAVDVDYGGVSFEITQIDGVLEL